MINFPKLSIKRHVSDVSYEDDPLKIDITLSNKRPIVNSFLEIYDYFEGERKTKKEDIFLLNKIDGYGKASLERAVNCYKRGYWKIGPINIVNQDIFALFRKKTRYDVVSHIIVYPKLFDIYRFPELLSGNASWVGVETSKISGDSHEFFGIREYQSGDSMSRIHWQSTARHNSLIVKQFERNALKEATIIFDLEKGTDIGSGKDTTLEYSVKIAGSIAKYLLNKGALVQMVGYPSGQFLIPFGKGEDHMHRILEYLAKVQSKGSVSLDKALEEIFFLTPPRSTLITILRDNDNLSLDGLMHFKANGIKLIIIILAAQTFQDKEIEDFDTESLKRFEDSLLNLDAVVYKVSKGDKLSEVFYKDSHA